MTGDLRLQPQAGGGAQGQFKGSAGGRRRARFAAEIGAEPKPGPAVAIGAACVRLEGQAEVLRYCSLTLNIAELSFMRSAPSASL
jgi:hypothetical protein|eukprot:COSAG02_NODE_1403_length_12811_cov_8.982536_7_plen_85_part_00